MQAFACIETVSQRKTRRGRAGVAPRDRILEGAVDLLARYGLDAVTMRQLGEHVGLDNSSLYRHFRSKAELVDAALDRVAGELLASVGPAIDLARPLTLEAFEDACATAALYFFDHPAAARLMLHWILSMGAQGPGFDASAPAGDPSRPHGALVAAASRWLAAGARRGILRRHGQPEALVVLFAAILVRPATYGYLLHTLEPKRDRAAARKAWEQELRAVVRGAFAA
jgi:AcrR family transcriptional regulator